MTIEELQSAPQAQDVAGAPSVNDNGSESDNHNDLRSLVLTLAKKADERSAELAERVAFLEGQRSAGNNTSAPSEAATTTTDSNDKALRGPLGRRLGSTRAVSLARTKEESAPTNCEEHGLSAHPTIQNTDEADPFSINMNEDMPLHSTLRSVRGIPEDDPVEVISDRVMLIERRLEAYDEEKSVFDERKYLLPESTFSLLITHPPNSVPFMFAAFSMALSISCLTLTLLSSIQNGSRGNWLGIPGGVDPEVRAAQFLGKLVFQLFEGPFSNKSCLSHDITTITTLFDIFHLCLIMKVY